jgi:GST-like protein
MIDLYYWTTPNGHKVMMYAEETGLEHRIVPVNISKGEQFSPEFLAIAPNNKIPAMVDYAPHDGGPPIAIFESGAILAYLAERTGKLLPESRRERIEINQWLFWQTGGLGPMAGQTIHFRHYAPERLAYPTDRFTNETNRLFGVLERRLADREFLVGEAYSIADIAIYPWINANVRLGQDMAQFPALSRWFEAVKARPATIRAYERGQEINSLPNVNEQSRRILFGQTATRA